MKPRYLLFALLMLWTTTSAMAEVIVENAWVRMPPPVVDTAAAYLTLRNDGDVDVTITSVESDAAAKATFHSAGMSDGMMHMQKMEQVVVPAGGSLEFAPGKDHLMLQGLKRELKAGEHITLIINILHGEAMIVHVEIRDMRSRPAEAGNRNHEH